MKKPERFKDFIEALESLMENSEWTYYEEMECRGIKNNEVEECWDFLDYLYTLDEVSGQETCHNVKSIDPYRFKFGQLFDFECSKCGAIVWDFTMEKKGQGAFGTPKFCPYCGAEVGEHHASTQE